ncbi:hypothetical protein CA207_14270 [Macrococcoides caseolyticum]|uniref:DUF3440 domain-containing protein n=1 Tax=Macrococcoides caseolyticum TaxID=69966 RepID=UPI000A28FD57|nr:DUF3440 domain-containing protein [Macrococcus caseolyticus]ARQ04673.1 hypothetical protein CA207_14270 [Macrococcus caseolyticus]
MKKYLDVNVYDATQKRLNYIFNNFDKVLVAFSGGKDSGVTLNLAYDYAKKHNMLHKLAVYHLDYEAQYQMTTDYVTETFERLDDIERFWLCLPIKAQSAVSNFEYGWIPWNEGEKDIWVREMPEYDFVVNEYNVPFKFNKDEWDYDIQKRFTDWYSKGRRVATLIGIRTTESLNRWRAIKGNHKLENEKTWIVKEGNTFKTYPIYDWNTEDIWVCNAKFGYSYNKLYDLYYQAGLKVDEMRVASPFNDAAISTLKLYKVIDPNNWAKMVGRVKGVNFSGIYGGTTAMGWKSIKLPEGHTWKSYMYFLLDTLPEEVRQNYLNKLETSIKFWREKGGVLDDETINELKQLDIDFEVGEKTNYKTTKKPVTFKEYPDDLDVTNFKLVPTYKRMCICIMKNDHLCKYMGFSQTKAETKRRREAVEKYENIL